MGVGIYIAIGLTGHVQCVFHMWLLGSNIAVGLCVMDMWSELCVPYLGGGIEYSSRTVCRTVELCVLYWDCV